MARKAQIQTIDPAAITALVAALTQSGALDPAAIAALTNGKAKSPAPTSDRDKWQAIENAVRAFTTDKGEVHARITGPVHFASDATTERGMAYGLSAVADTPALAVVKYSVSAKGNVYASSPKLTAVTESDIQQLGEWLEVAVNGVTTAPRPSTAGSDPVAAINAAVSRADVLRVLKAHGHNPPPHAARMRLDTLQARAVELLQG